MKKLCCICAALLLLTACGQEKSPADASGSEPPAAGQGQAASSGQMAPVENVVEADMVPIYGGSLKDGTYAIAVDSSSPMFKIESCELNVKSGRMTAVMRMGGKGYLSVFMGTGEAATRDAEIPFREDGAGNHTFTVPVEALDKGISCAAFSKNKELWYDRTLVFRADSLPLDAFQEGVYPTAVSLGLADGSYTVEMELSGGSGKASVRSPPPCGWKTARPMSQLCGAAPITTTCASARSDFSPFRQKEIPLLKSLCLSLTGGSPSTPIPPP